LEVCPRFVAQKQFCFLDAHLQQAAGLKEQHDHIGLDVLQPADALPELDYQGLKLAAGCV